MVALYIRTVPQRRFIGAARRSRRFRLLFISLVLHHSLNHYSTQTPLPSFLESFVRPPPRGKRHIHALTSRYRRIRTGTLHQFQFSAYDFEISGATFGTNEEKRVSAIGRLSTTLSVFPVLSSFVCKVVIRTVTGWCFLMLLFYLFSNGSIKFTSILSFLVAPVSIKIEDFAISASLTQPFVEVVIPALGWSVLVFCLLYGRKVSIRRLRLHWLLRVPYYSIFGTNVCFKFVMGLIFLFLILSFFVALTLIPSHFAGLFLQFQCCFLQFPCFLLNMSWSVKHTVGTLYFYGVQQFFVFTG